MCKKIFQFKRMWLLLGFVAAALLIGAARLSNGWVEIIYARGFYPLLEKSIGRGISLFPFSVSEWLIVAALIAVIGYIVYTVVWLVRHRTAWKHGLYRFFITVLCILSLAVFFFVICMGLNYYRAPATDYLGITPTKYSKQQLAQVCRWLVSEAAAERGKLTEGENGVVMLQTDDWSEISLQARDAFNKMGAQYEGIGTVAVRCKPMVFSKVMSHLLTMGVYIPYTFESNINVDMPAYTVPATMCHELAHVKGFMREDEANFLSFLACEASENADFRYSGLMMALKYALPQLAAVDRSLAVEAAQLASEGMVADERFDAAYWDQYFDTVIADTSQTVYDAYLQANDQQDGMQSYGRMVDLVLAWYYR